MVDQSLPSTLLAYVSDSQDIPCGILKGGLTSTTTFQVEWDIYSSEFGTEILPYHSSDGNTSVTHASGRYTYHPLNDTLHVRDFDGFQRSEVRVVCIASRAIPNSESQMSTRTINVSISFGESCVIIL